MAKKRLTFDVDEAVHSRLKAEAANAGLPLGAHCAHILKMGSGSTEPQPASVEFDLSEVALMPLDKLREACNLVTLEKPADWKSKAALLNLEIRRRFRI